MTFQTWVSWNRIKWVLSHETARFYHDLSDILPKHVYLTVPEAWRVRRRRVAAGPVLRYGHVSDADRTWLGPVSITKRSRAIRDVIDTQLSSEHIERAIGDARRRGLISRDEADPLEAQLRES